MKTLATLTLSCLSILIMAMSPVDAQSRQGRGFSDASLTGCYGTHEQGDGAVSAGLGVVCYDGNGGSTRSLTVNAPDGAGGRRILKFESTGTYSVNPNGTGAADYTNHISGAPDTMVSDDFVITGTASTWIPGKGRPGLQLNL